MLGADELIDYKTQPLEDVIHDYDAAFDTVGGETYARSLSVNERWNNCFHVRAGKLGSHATIWRESNFQLTQINRERLTKLAQWVDENNIMVNVEKTFSPDEAGDAFDYQKDVHPRGKVVLAI